RLLARAGLPLLRFGAYDGERGCLGLFAATRDSMRNNRASPSIRLAKIGNCALAGLAISTILVGSIAAAFADPCSGVEGEAGYLKGMVENTISDINGALFFERNANAKAQEF